MAAAVAAALCLTPAAPVLAQAAPPPPSAPSAAELAAARQLFTDAIRATDEGRWRDALEAFRRVAKVIVSPQVRYQIGLCHEKLGEPVEALNSFELAIQEGEARRAPDVVKESRAHADAIRRKIAHLVLRVPADAAGVTITLDGRPINAALAGTSMPVNPGDLKIAVRAENYAGAFEVTLSVAPGESRTVDATLGTKKSAEPAPPVAPPPVAPLSRPAAPPPVTKRNYVPAIVSGSATLGFTVAAVATGVAAHSDYSTYIRENVNPPKVSYADRDALRSAGMGKAWASTALTLGAIAGGGLTIFFVVRAATDAPPRAVAWAPWAGPDGAGLSFRGTL